MTSHLVCFGYSSPNGDTSNKSQVYTHFILTRNCVEVLRKATKKIFHFEICSYDCVKNRDIDHVEMPHHIIFSCSGESRNKTSDITCPDIRHVLKPGTPEHARTLEHPGKPRNIENKK